MRADTQGIPPVRRTTAPDQNPLTMSEQHAENNPPEAPALRAPATREERRLLLTKKQRRLGERLAELGIFSVATVSILAIFLKIAPDFTLSV